MVRKFVENMRKYRIMFKDILTFLGLDYRDAPFIILYLAVLRISIPKIEKLYHIKIYC